MEGFIQSASGWRKVFAISGNENDTTEKISDSDKALIYCSTLAFLQYLKETLTSSDITVAIARDTRPTGPAIVDVAIKSLARAAVKVKYLGVACAPEVMCYAACGIGHDIMCDAFLYVSASHNPVGHNGLKFGLSYGGVLSADENKKVVDYFCEIYDSYKKTALNGEKLGGDSAMSSDFNKTIDAIYAASPYLKAQSISLYENFFIARTTGLVGGDFNDAKNKFTALCDGIKNSGLSITADFNGSARCLSIDSALFKKMGIPFYAINNDALVIAHGIIPEGNNLSPLAAAITKKQNDGVKGAVLGYTCDCDGDRGNVVIWDERKKATAILSAQEGFAMATLCALSYAIDSGVSADKICVVCNCATSMRIDDIARIFGARVVRCEVGEANVVNCARHIAQEGFTVCIAGEGSNGGVIIPPNFVRDPMDTVFLLLKLLCNKRLFKTWCEKAGLLFSDNYSISDITETLPRYTTTSTTDKRATLHIRTSDCKTLERRFQNLFTNEWAKKKNELFQKYGILSHEIRVTNGVNERRAVKDYSTANTGGLKIVFFDENNSAIAFLWMRKSGTEPVFRIMCDVKGDDEKSKELEGTLLQWFTQMIKTADE